MTQNQHKLDELSAKATEVDLQSFIRAFYIATVTIVKTAFVSFLCEMYFYGKRLIGMQKKHVSGMMRFLLAGMLIVIGFSFQRDEVISGDLAFLIGDYEYICSYDNGVKKEATETEDKYTLRITKKSEMLLYKNGKKIDKYRFSDVKLPVLDEYEYVMFNKKVGGTLQNYPLFYKGDTVVMHIIPFEFNDNYFRKR